MSVNDTTMPASRQAPDMLGAALSYAERGWSVFPVKPDKTPRTQHGFKDATTDAAQIRRWWGLWPDAGIGIPTGAVSGLVVIDVDSAKDPRALDTMRDLEASYAPLPDTVQQQTGGGGYHLFFEHPGDAIPNGVGTASGLGLGVDVRGDGGYVVVPPSLHASGRRYQWTEDHEAFEIPIEPLPDWLLALLRGLRDRNGQRPTEASSGAPDTPIPEGSRNDTLFRYGCNLRGMGLDETGILDALAGINAARCRPPLPESDVRCLARQAAQYAPGTRPPVVMSGAAEEGGDGETEDAEPQATSKALARIRSVEGTKTTLPHKFWFRSQTLDDLSTHRHDPVAWGYIMSMARANGIDQRYLASSIDDRIQSLEEEGVYGATIDQYGRKDVEWLWEPYIPMGMVSIIDGDPGIGKTFLALALSAAITQGAGLPDQQGVMRSADPACARRVLYLSAEDSIEHTIAPRLDALGVSTQHFFIPSRMLPDGRVVHAPVRHTALLEKLIVAHTPSLVVLDPLQAFLPSGADANNMSDVRPFVRILGELAELHHAAIVCLRHWNKGSGAQKAIYRGGGSIDFNATARSVLSVAEDPDDDTRVALYHIKTNIGKLGATQLYRIYQNGMPFAWDGVSTATIRSATAPTGKRQGDATKFLQELLAEGPVARSEVTARADALGISEITLRRAREALGILSHRDEFDSQYYWRLPRLTRGERGNF